MTVARILKEKGQLVLTAKPDATLREVVATLAQKKIGALVVSADVEGPAGDHLGARHHSRAWRNRGRPPSTIRFPAI